MYGTYHGTRSGGEWLGIPTTNRKFAIDAVDLFRVQDGKLAEHWDVMDVYGLFRQLGVIKQLSPSQVPPTPPASPSALLIRSRVFS